MFIIIYVIVYKIYYCYDYEVAWHSWSKYREWNLFSQYSVLIFLSQSAQWKIRWKCFYRQLTVEFWNSLFYVWTSVVFFSVQFFFNDFIGYASLKRSVYDYGGLIGD